MVDAGLPGLDFQNSFNVPVFKTKVSNSGVIIDTEKYEDYTVKQTLDVALQNTRITLQSNTDHDLHMIFHAKFPALIQWIIASTAVLMYLFAQIKIFTFIPTFTGSAAAIIPIIVFSVFLIILLLLYFGFNMYELQLLINRKELRFRSKLWFIKTDNRYSFSQIKQNYTEVKNQSKQRIQPYKLVLETNDKTVTVSDIIPGKHIAELLEQKINQTINQFRS